MKILQSEKTKLLRWINTGKSIYWLHDYLVNTCGYHQLEAKEIIGNIDNIEVFPEQENEYKLKRDADGWYIEEYNNNELVFAVMGNSVSDCYRQMFS